MSEEHLDSVKLELEEKEREKSDLEVVESSKSAENMGRGDHNLSEPQDGADEKMLGSGNDEKSALAMKDIEVKFISGDQNTNGDAKIDIGNLDKQAFTGMTKEELMKYANDPFWVRLRWILFIGFWAIWIGMLVGAISIIVFAPKCTAPAPLAWWKEGPIVKITGDENAEKIKEIADFKPKAVIYELQKDETYLVDTPAIKEKIEKIVKEYETNEIHVVLDLTPNIVKDSDEFFVNAKKDDDWSNFIKNSASNNWKQVGGEKPAWDKQTGNNYILTQFDGYYGLNMRSEKVQYRLIGVLKSLAGLGVKGFRFNNAKYFLVNETFADEKENLGARGTAFSEGQYGFYHHIQTTYVNGLGDLLSTFQKAVFNATDGNGFLTISDNIANNAEVFKINGTSVFGVDIPLFGFVNQYMKKSPDSAKFLQTGFDNVDKAEFNIANSRIQLPFEAAKIDDADHIGYPAYKIFVSLLPGVQIATIDEFKKNADDKIDKALKEARVSPSFHHGGFEHLISVNNTAFGYTRVKAGNPGYFVVINPSNEPVTANFNDPKVDRELTPIISSFEDDDAFKFKGKVMSESISLPKQSAAIFTFVPKA